MKYVLILPLFLLFIICGILYADAILLKDGQELKGVIVEDYADRVVLSTEGGQVCLLKDAIEKIDFEDPEQNLVKLGRAYREKGDYKQAMYYYKSAYRLNPKMKEASDGITSVTNMAFRQGHSELEKKVAGRQDLEEKRGNVLTAAGAETEAPSEAEQNELWNGMGIAIGTEGPDIKVTRVLNGSRADSAGIKEGDIIVSVWGKLIRYMDLRDVYGLILHSGASEIKLALARPKTIALRRNHIFRGAEYMLGARLSVAFEGLIVNVVEEDGPFYKAGINKGDRITRLSGVTTMYMPLETVYKSIEDMKDDILYLDIQREAVL